MEPLRGGGEHLRRRSTCTTSTSRNGAPPWRRGAPPSNARAWTSSAGPQWSPSVEEGSTPRPHPRRDRVGHAAMEPLRGGGEHLSGVVVVHTAERAAMEPLRRRRGAGWPRDRSALPVGPPSRLASISVPSHTRGMIPRCVHWLQPPRQRRRSATGCSTAVPTSGRSAFGRLMSCATRTGRARRFSGSMSGFRRLGEPPGQSRRRSPFTTVSTRWPRSSTCRCHGTSESLPLGDRPDTG